MKNNTQEKVLINFKIDKDLRDRFIEICKINDTTGTQELRKFIKKYLSENSQLLLK